MGITPSKVIRLLWSSRKRLQLTGLSPGMDDGRVQDRWEMDTCLKDLFGVPHLGLPILRAFHQCHKAKGLIKRIASLKHGSFLVRVQNSGAGGWPRELLLSDYLRPRYYPLPTTHYYKLSTTCDYKVSIYYPLPSTHYLLPTGDYLLPIADHLLHTAYLETSVAFLRSSAVAMLDGSRNGGTTTYGPMQWQWQWQSS